VSWLLFLGTIAVFCAAAWLLPDRPRRVFWLVTSLGGALLAAWQRNLLFAVALACSAWIAAHALQQRS
jgi:hypothetical protein